MEVSKRYRIHAFGAVCILGIFLLIIAQLLITRIRLSGGFSLSQYDINWMMLVSFVSAISTATLLVAINRSKNIGRIGMWYSLYLLSILAWAIGQGFSMTARSSDVYFAWAMLSYVSIVMMCPLFILFILSFTQNDRLLYKWYTLGILLFVATLMAYTLGEGRLIWNWANPNDITPGPLNIYYVVYIPLSYLIGLVLLHRYWRKQKDPAVRRQARLMFFGILITISIGTLTDLVIPFFVAVPPLGLVCATLATLVFSYSIFRYGISVYDPAALAATIVRSVKEGIVVVDNRNVVQQINAAASFMLNITPEDATGSSWHDISHLSKSNHTLPTQERPDYLAQLHNQATEIGQEDNIYLHSHDRKTPIAMTITPLEVGKGTGAVIDFRDITKDKQATAIIERTVQERTQELHKTQTQLLASVNSLKQGYIMTDHAGNILTMNHAASLLFCPAKHGKQKQHLPQCTMENIVASLQGHMDLAANVAAVMKGRKTLEYESVPLGAKFFHIYISPIVMEGSPIGTTILVEDVTEARILDRSKDEFFSIASHELRTPLTAIRGNSSMLLQFYKDKITDHNAVDMINDIELSSIRLIDIVNDFLDLSRLEQGKVTFGYEAIALDEVIESVVYEMKAILQEKHLSLEFSHKTLGVLPKVWADKNRLKQIIYNLVGNAAKFTENGGITIDASHAGKAIKIRVIDTGRGISPEGQQLLFHKFQQAGESLLTRDTTRGTGLGLYISKMLAEYMNGSLTLEYSTEGKGSCFSFTIPMADGHPHAAAQKKLISTNTGLSKPASITTAASLLANPSPPPKKTSKQTGAKRKLLVVEDDPYVLRLYQRLFDSDRITIKTAMDGSQGYKLAQTFQPHLILLDMMMPIMDGLEALTALKKDPKTKDITVVMLSNLGEEDIVKKALAKGAANYMLKSNFTPEELRTVVEKQLATAHI